MPPVWDYDPFNSRRRFSPFQYGSGMGMRTSPFQYGPALQQDPFPKPTEPPPPDSGPEPPPVGTPLDPRPTHQAPGPGEAWPTPPQPVWSSPVSGWGNPWTPSTELEDPNRWRQELAEGNQQAWDTWGAMMYGRMLPYLGQQDFNTTREQLASWNPELAALVDEASWEAPYTRSSERGYQTGDYWSGIREGLEWGSQQLSGAEDPDSGINDPYEDATRFLGRVAEIGSQYTNDDVTRDLHRWQQADRLNEYAALRAAHEASLDPRVLALGDMLFNPSQRTRPVSPRAFMGGRYTWQPQGSEQYSADWAYRNSQWQ